MHGNLDAPSPWVVRWTPWVAAGPVLDVACGSGRHARWFASRGLAVVGIDREARDVPGIEVVQADLEDGNPWPLAGRRFGAVVVTNYLHRPLFGTLAAALAPSGVLIYETFMQGNERYGRPSNPDYLLRPGELFAAFGRLRIVAFEQGVQRGPRLAVVQRLFAQQDG